MKNRILSVVVLVVAFVFTNTLTAQEFSGLDKSPMDGASYPSSYKIADKVVKVYYGRPQLKERNMADLAPAGKVWRTGANEAAEITFFKDVTFGGKAVKAGTYSLFTIPGEKSWTVILSTARNVWGSYFYKESEDVVRVDGAVSSSDKSIEAFSIAFTGEGNAIKMHMGWANTVVTVPIKG